MALAAPALVAQQSDRPTVAPLPLELVLHVKRLGEYAPMRFSPDSRWLAYTVRDAGRSTSAARRWSLATLARTGVPWSAIGAEVWVTETATGTTRRLLDGVGEDWAPAWSPDGRSVALISNQWPTPRARHHSIEDQLARPWVWNASTGSAHLIADVSVRGFAPQLQWSPDSRRILTTLLPFDTGSSVQACPVDVPLPGCANDGRRVVDATVTVYRAGPSVPADAANGAWSLARPVDVAWLDIATGAVQRVVRNTRVATLRLSPDGHRIAYTVADRFEAPGSQQVLYDLAVLADGQPPRVVAHDIRLNYDGAQFSWGPDGTRLAYRTAGMLAAGELYVVGVDGAAPRLVTGRAHPAWQRYAATGPLWDAAGASLYFADSSSVWRAAANGSGVAEIARLSDRTPTLLEQRPGQLWQLPNSEATVVLARDRQRGASAWFRIELASDSVRCLMETDHYIGGYGPSDGVVVSDDGRQLVYAMENVGKPSDLYETPGIVLSPPRQLTHLNPEFDRYVMGERRLIAWRSLDGETIQGVLLLPSGYEAGTRYPLLTKVYGGAFPTESDANRFGAQHSPVDNLQLFATRGYAVLLPDIPLHREGQVTLDLLKVVLPGVDKAIEEGIADPARLGLFGHSFGGYNTIALLTETTRFGAAVMSAGEADLVASYGQMSPDGTTYGIAGLEHGQFLLNATPWQQPERYLENSPILHLDRVTTPLLIVHGGDDGAVAAHLADEVFVGLRRLGHEVVYAKYAGEEHHQAQWSLANQLDYWDRVIAWFDDHLGGQDAKSDGATK